MRRHLLVGGLAIAGLAAPGCVFNDIRDEMIALNGKVENLSGQLDLLQVELENLRNLPSASESLAAVDRDLDAANEELAAIDDDLTQANEELRRINEGLGVIDPSLTKIDQHLESLRRTISNIDSTIPFLSISDDPEVEDAAEEETPADAQTAE